MSDPTHSLSELLSGLDARSDAFHVNDLYGTVVAYAKAHPERSAEEDIALKAEMAAFSLVGAGAGETTEWSTHFATELAWETYDPVIAALTPEMVAYWKSRARACGHPRLRARYADAAWDLEPRVADGKRDADMARIAIDAYVDDACLPEIELEQIDALARALYLALKLRDEVRVGKVPDAIIAFQKRLTNPTEPYTIWFHFDALYEQRKKVKLAPDQISDMIAGMERQLAAWSDPQGEGFDPFSAREIGRRLVQHYKASDGLEGVKLVVQTYAKALLHLAGEANGILAHPWLEELHQDYLDAGLRSEADSLVPDIRKAGERMAGEMAHVSVPIGISNDEMEQFCQGITEDGAEAAVARIVETFTPDPEHLRAEMHKVAAKHPLMGMIPVTIADEFTSARAGGVQEDESGRLVMDMHQHMAFESVFLHPAVDRLISRYGLGADTLVELLYHSELFAAERKALLVTSVRHYLATEYASFVHVVIPQIEHLLRRLLQTLGGVTVSFDSETKTYRERDLGTVLRDPRMEGFWKQATGKDVALYLRVVLTDQRAMNARNLVCHGLCDPGWFSP